MYLKSLTVLGFKSFADKTTLNFQPGVTAIVGPNGCGKSNVSDAIRWVLGEQSAKALRGGEMADVIFNGTDSRKPLGMAEVSLTIGDFDGEPLKAAGIPCEFNEVTLTRRVFRDGGSEYFLNKVSCRLRDIQQLFLGTGVGRTSYSIMAQGNITQILSSKPDDRRLVFEEAAGITRFKAQKKEALRKLESTEQNLLRVQDLIREVKRQIGSLQRQAGKARRYKALATELQHLDTQLARHQFDVLVEEIADRSTQADRARLEMEVCQESVLRLEDEMLKVREALSAVEHRISQAQQNGLELKAQSDRHESRIQFNEERLGELENQNRQATGDIAQAGERRSAAESEFASVTERWKASESQLGSLRAVLEEKRNALSEVERDLARRQEALRQAQNRAFSATQAVGRARSELNQLALRQQGNLARMEQLRAEQVQAGEEQTGLELRLAEFTEAGEAERLQVQTSRMTLEERQQRLRSIQTEIQQAQQALDAWLRQQAEKRSRLSVLEQLDTAHEGFSSGALAALKQSVHARGSLADRLRVPDEFVPAVEAALDRNLQLVLTEQPEHASEILKDLSTHRRGRATLAALQISRNEAGLQEAEIPPGAVALIQHLSPDESIRPLLKALLGRTLVVDSLDAAVDAHRACRGAFDFVTKSGDILTAAGVFTGGAQGQSGKAPASILGRKNQIAELQGELAQLQEHVNEASRKKGALQSEQTNLQAGLEQARLELRQQEVAVATRQGEFNALQNSKRSLAVRLEHLVRDLAGLTAQESGVADQRDALTSQVERGETEERESSALVTELTAGLEEVRHLRDQAGQAVNDAKVALATEEQLCASHARQRGPLEQRIRELTSLIDRLTTEVGGFGDRRANFVSGIEESKREIARLAEERKALSEQITQLVDERRFQEGEVGSRDEQLKEQRARYSNLQTRRGQLEVELAQKKMGTENLRERIQSRYQVNLDDIRGEGIRITFVDEGPAKVEAVSLEEMESAGLTNDWDSVAKQVAILQKRVEEIGPVNLVAIEEYEETEQRHTFLTTQHDDLVKAKEQLTEVLNKINGETKTMFLETFEKIRANFQVMFTEMFGGGKADLRLVDEGDVLESGIDIMARPPGKQLQSISLLSGGEQTMTAVALLFSIYQVKPSPFCVLDELDAPLDESNINRFLKVLKRFLENSQFVIITHNKRTIGMADILYGVTMQERGVSKIVSVKFNRDTESPGNQLESPTIVDSLNRTAGDQEVMMAK